MRVSSFSSSQARCSLSNLMRTSKLPSSSTAWRYSSHSASNSGSLAIRSRTISSSSGQCASNERIRSTMPLDPLFTQSAMLPQTLSSLDEIGDIGLALDLPNLRDDFGIGQCRYVTGILVVRDGPQDATHDLPGTGLRHVGHDHDAARTGDRADLADYGLFDALANLLARLVF